MNVEVAVTNPEGKFIPHLTAENFRVREDGVPQAVAHFAPTRAPVRIALLVEASPAVFLIREEHLQAARHLLAGLRPEDEAALVTYARLPRVEVDFTRDKRQVEGRLLGLGRFSLGMAEVQLSRAVAGTLEWLSPPRQRTAVLVIGTGLDTGDPAHWTALERQVAAGQVAFFAVATGRLLRGTPEKKDKPKRDPPEASESELDAAFFEAHARLRGLAAAGAGQAYFPESAQELDQIYRDLAERLRNLYSLGYYPTNAARDGGYRAITVELVDPTGAPLHLRDPGGNPVAYRVFARPGYFAPRE